MTGSGKRRGHTPKNDFGDNAGSTETARQVLPQKSSALPDDLVAHDRPDFLKKLLADESAEEETQLAVQEPEDVYEILVFDLAGERYGLDIQKIHQIVRYIEPTDVPHTVPFLDGIISLRGRMIPVINGRKRLGHDPAPVDKKTRIIVLKEDYEYEGIVVDSTRHVVRVPRSAIEPTPPVVVGIEAEFIDGICEHKGQLIVLLNLERFLQI